MCSIVVPHGMGIKSKAHPGKTGINKNLMPTINDGANIAFPIAINSDSFSLSKQPGSMLNVHLITFSVVNRMQSCEKTRSNEI